MRRTFALVTVLGGFCFLFLSRYATVLPWLRWWRSSLPLEDDLEGSGYLIRTPACQIPAWDPFDPSVIRLYHKVSDYVCPGKTSFLRVRPNAVLQVDEGILWRQYRLSRDQINCSFQPVRRVMKVKGRWTDSRFELGSQRPFQFGVPLGEHHVIVHCLHAHREILLQHIPLIPVSQRTERRLRRFEEASLSTSTPKLNILMVGLDSISNLNFERHLPKTKAFLKDVLGAVQLHGYTKIGDNTFPNLMALLTGHFLEYYWNETMKNFFFDGLDFIWKEFAQRGHRTLFAEDAPDIATFNYLKRGFARPPSDYYLRPLCVATERSSMRSRSGSHCWGSKMEVDVVFDYLADFAEAFQSKPHFGFAFAARLTHDHLNNAGYADAPSLRLLRKLHFSGALRNTLLVFFSDHGLRFGKIRTTYVGKLEERMPIMFLAFPESFLEQHPAQARALRINSRRLTTPFDVHATLQQLASKSPEEGHQTMHGLSLFQEVPLNRTCEDASIFPHWCTCQNRTVVATTDPGVLNASHALIGAINARLTPSAARCDVLLLDKVFDARQSQPNEKVLRFVTHHNDVIGRRIQLGRRTAAPIDYLITLRVRPSGALLEGTVRYFEPTDQYTLLGDVSRLDKYGRQGDCIRDATLRKFCHCRSMTAPVAKTTTRRFA